MRLCAIELENFKGISTRQRIELNPITLLFGPNSVGKSSIILALHYLREILERQNVNPDETVAGGIIDLGGFQNMVHDHDLTRTIRIKVEIDLKGDNGNERLPLNYQGVFEDIKRFNNFFSTRYLTGYNNDKLQFAIVENVGIEAEVTWSDLLKVPYVSIYTVFMDKEKIASILSPPQKGRAVLTEINFKHPLICLFDEINEEEIEEDELFVESIVEMVSPAGTELGEEISAFSQIMKVSQNEIDFDKPENYKIAVHTKLGALPLLNKTLELELTDIKEEYYNKSFSEEKSINKTIESFEERKSLELQQAGLTDFLDELMLGPARVVLDYLESTTYIGPLREIPDRNYQPKLSPDISRWANGLAAWDLLYEGSNDKLIKQVNAWLFEENRLNTGYKLEKAENKTISVPSHFNQLFERGIDEDDLGVLQEIYNNLPTDRKIFLRDFNKDGVLVEPIDVGVGISQMLPVVVACLKSGEGLRIIEQPELHIHPALQVSLGDLFIEIVQSEDNPENPPTSLLIETHSEHIILRLIRRIRENFEAELPENTIGLDPSDVSVYYVQDTAKGVQFKKLRIDEEGEFIDRWPDGFFDERAAELF